MMSGKKQIPFNLSNRGGAITITCNLGKQGISNILPPRTCRHKTAFLVIDETDTDKLRKRTMPHADEFRVRESESGILSGTGHGVGISGNNDDTG